MRLLDKILYKRLGRIREELNSFIADNLEITSKWHSYEEHPPVEHGVMYQETVGRTMEKFLQVMPMKENVSNLGYEDEGEVYEEDSYVLPSLKSSHPAPMISAPQIRIPDYLTTETRKKSIDQVLENRAETFSTMLLRLIDEKGLKDSEVYKNANIDRRLFSKIRGDKDYIPSKKTAISFCLALQLEMEQARKLLETAGYAFSTASRFDLIIMYLIENKEYNIHFANIVLEDYGEGTLSK